MIDPLIGRMIDGRYRLESHLGTGGVGRVYLARHVLIGRRVAIKVLQPERRSQSHLRAWFLREARAANRVNHANIVEIHDFGETEDGLAYIVMELLDGRPLSAEITKGPMPMQVAVDVIEQVCAALARAHDLGVVHRDIKPENIFLLEKAGRSNFVKLLDFGLARLAQDARLAAPGAVFGTPEYMSPEQAKGEEATAQSDLYALGVVFYEAVTGRLPFDSPNRDNIPNMHITKAPLPPTQLIASIDSMAETIIMRLLAKDPKNRYRDAHHLLDDLKELVLRSQPSVSSPALQVAASRPEGQASSAQPTSANLWALRAAAFGRMVARAHAHGGAPPEMVEDLERMWRLVAVATKVEAEVNAQYRAVEALERRGREFRGQAGRKIEELARAESRLRRKSADTRQLIDDLETRQKIARDDLARAEISIRTLTRAGAVIDPNQLRVAAEVSGAAKASISDTEKELSRQKTALQEMMDEKEQLKKQIHHYRERLSEQTDAYEIQLRQGRSQLAKRAGETQKLTDELDRVSADMTRRLRTRPECLTLLEELPLLESHMPPPPQ